MIEANQVSVILFFNYQYIICRQVFRIYIIVLENCGALI